MSNFQHSVALLLDLCQLDPDSAEADAVRDQMEPLWYTLTGEEQQLLGRLSAALNRVHRSEP